MKDIYIFGASGFARETAILIQEMQEYNIKAFVDIKSSDISVSVNGKLYPIISEGLFYNICQEDEQFATIAISDVKITSKIIEKFQEICTFPNIIHKSSNFHGDFMIGIGNIITYNCIFTDNIKIGSFNRFNVGAIVGHDVKIGNNNQFNPACKISGNVSIGNNNFFGVNSVVLQGVKISDNIIVGASSLILKKTITPGTYIGVPAKKFDY